MVAAPLSLCKWEARNDCNQWTGLVDWTPGLAKTKCLIKPKLWVSVLLGHTTVYYLDEECLSGHRACLRQVTVKNVNSYFLEAVALVQSGVCRWPNKTKVSVQNISPHTSL